MPAGNAARSGRDNSAIIQTKRSRSGILPCVRGKRKAQLSHCLLNQSTCPYSMLDTNQIKERPTRG